MPDTRPGITFMEDGVCAPCHNYEKQKHTDWDARMEELKALADGPSVVNPGVMREGFVYRSLDGQDSFKNVSREYLLKHNG